LNGDDSESLWEIASLLYSMTDVLLSLSIAIGLGVLFFYLDYTQKGPRLHRSFLAGFSMSYFFLVVLPEVSLNLPEIPEYLENFKFGFILLGFIFVHLAEKLIFKTVAQEAQKQAKELDQREFNLKMVENSIGDFLTSSIRQDDLDIDAIKELNNIILSLNDNHKELAQQIMEIKWNITTNIMRKVDQLQESMKFVYHFLVGAILIGLLQYDWLAGILFFIFAFFMAILSNKARELPELEMTLGMDLNRKTEESHSHTEESHAHTDSHHSKVLHGFLACSILFGIIWGLIFEIIVGDPLEMLYLSFSFTSGVILYNIMLRVIPKNEKDQLGYFIFGVAVFALFILSINIFAHRFI
jgi:hypothetical protein